MQVIVVKDYEEGARIGADIIEKIVRDNPEACLGLATGSSPIGMYRELARRCREEGLDFSKVHSVNLDEYVGLEGTHDQSYRYFMNENLFNHINIDKKNTFVVKATGDIEANLKEFNDILAHTDRDVQVLGVGPDGHLGFNEPGDTLYDEAHMETLEDSTIEANKRFFEKKEDVPTTALTMGMGGIMQAKKLLMIVAGNKEEAMRKLLIEGKIDSHCPCTFMRMHRDAVVIIEKALADKVGYKG